MSTNDGLSAACRQCGATLPIRLAGPPLVCEACGDERPLADDIAAQVERLRNDVSRHGAAAQQLAGKQRMLGSSGSLAQLIMMVTLWTVFGASCLPLADPLPPDLEIRRFLCEGAQRSAGLLEPRLVNWWVLFTFAIGVSLSLMLWAFSRLAVARVARSTWPSPPAAEGRPPRCRCCGDELPSEGNVRRCTYCSAEHMVMGERYQHHQASLDRALGELRKQTARTLVQRERMLDRIASFTLFAPLILPLVALALAFLAPATYPLLWSAPFAALALGILFIVAGSLVVAPSPRVLDELRPGDALLVADQRLQVHARTSAQKTGRAISIYLLRAPTDSSERAIVIRLRKNDFEGQTYTVAAGGAPWDPPAEGGTTIQKLVTSPDSPLAGRKTLAVEATDTEVGPLRFWAERPSKGEIPLLSLTPEAKVQESELVMIAQDD